MAAFSGTLIVCHHPFKRWRLAMAYGLFVFPGLRLLAIIPNGKHF
jgi:hypothetical protein